MTRNSNPRVVAISSGGGHWVELFRMRTAWDACDVAYVTTIEGYKNDVFKDANERGQHKPRYYTVIDANRWQKWKLVWQLLSVMRIIIKERPDVIVSTGAAPGFFALIIGKFFGARTIWVDSIANAASLSLAGKLAGKSADLWLTQWAHLAGSEDRTRGLPTFKGSVV